MHLLSHRVRFILLRERPVGTLITITPALAISWLSLDLSLVFGRSDIRSIPRSAASSPARCSFRSTNVTKLKSWSIEAGVARSARLRYAAGSRTPEHCDHSLCLLMHGREQVFMRQRGHVYLIGFT